MRRFAFFGLLLAPLVLAALSGCGDPQNRQEISGEVKLKGKPVEDGIINFEPLDGQETGDGAQIVMGKYRIPREKGLSPGKYQVRIYAGDGRSGAGDASPDSPFAGQKAGQERVPPKYNTKSEIVKEITQNGPNTFNFDIP